MSYVPPIPASAVADPVTRERMRHVAKYQRWVLFSLLANVIMNVLGMLSFAQVLELPPGVDRVWGIGLVIVVTLIVLSAFQLANQFFSDLASIIFALLMWVPLVSLIVLLILSQKATGFLTQHGVPVGFMGVSPRHI